MSAWESTLPQTQFLTLAYEPQDDRVQTPMEMGPPKIRPRSALAIAHVDVPAIFTGAQIATFTTFWVTTLVRGTQRFTWKDPTTGSTVSMSFRSRPAFQPMTSSATASERKWRTVLSLRIHT